MKRADWKKLIDSLPAGLTQLGASKRLGLPAGAVRYWIKLLDYRFKDGRRVKWSDAKHRQRQRVKRQGIDWSKTNSAIAREYGVSREAIRLIRNEAGAAKVNGRKSK